MKQGERMFEVKSAFSGFSVKSATDARKFYEETLGLKVTKHGYGTRVHLPGGAFVFFYPKGAAHKPAAYTMLNLVVDDIDEAIDELKKRGVKFDAGKYTDEKGIQRGLDNGFGHDQAWCKDPSGNIISIIREDSRT